MNATRVPRAVSGGKNALNSRVLRAYRAAVRRYAGKKWVTGVGIGMREREAALRPDEGFVIAIHVRHKVTRRARVPKGRLIPKSIQGVPTDVVEADYHVASGGGAATVSAGVLRPGVSVGRADGSGATLGGVVVDKGGKAYLLCAMHTLREGDKGKKGDPIIHPCPCATGAPLGVVATYERVHLGLDAGIARLGAGVLATNDALISDVTIGEPDFPAIGDILEKSGQATEVTQAIVQAVGTFLNMFPAIHLAPLAGDIDTTPLSGNGDSGAIWYDAITGRAKALHSSGSGVAPAGHEFGVATMLPFVLDGLKVRWAVGLQTG